MEPSKNFLGYGLTDGGVNRSATHLGQRELNRTFARPYAAAGEEGLAVFTDI